MQHAESVTAVLTSNEPANGSKLIVDKGDGWAVIWRDDAEADHWYDGDARDQHWFGDPREDPMSLHEHVKYAVAVYALGEQLAAFTP